MKSILRFLCFLPLLVFWFGQLAFAQDASRILLNAGAPSNGTSEVQTLTIGGSTTGGTFKLTFDGYTTSSITWSATTATLLANINTALDALSNLENGEVVATDSTLSSGNGALLLTFSGNRAKQNVNAMTVTNALTGGTHTLVLTTSTAGVDATFRDAPLGALLVNTTNKTFYQNRGTALNPTWTEIVGIAVTDSASVAALVSDETGTGLLVFGTGPTLGAAIVTPKVTTISGDGAITIASGVVVLTKGSAAAITLAAPSSQNGTRITVISTTDFAHVITVTGGLWDGTAGANTTATFSAVRGASCTFVAQGTAWYVESLNAVTPAP